MGMRRKLVGRWYRYSVKVAFLLNNGYTQKGTFVRTRKEVFLMPRAHIDRFDDWVNGEEAARIMSESSTGDAGIQRLTECGKERVPHSILYCSLLACRALLPLFRSVESVVRSRRRLYHDGGYNCRARVSGRASPSLTLHMAHV